MQNHLTQKQIVKEAAENSSFSVHPMNSSRIMQGLISLSKQGECARDKTNSDSLDGVISKSILRQLLSALHYRDVATIIHTRRVAHLSVEIAEALGWSEQDLRFMEIAALLHDIGKIGIPDYILNKPGQFSSDEMDLMALHNHIGFDILQACRVDSHVLEIINQAHIHCNGALDASSFSKTKEGLGGRILAVADAYDSLTNNQVFRKALSHDEAIQQLEQSENAKFDGNVISVLDRILTEPSAISLLKELAANNSSTQDVAHSVNQFAPLTPDDIQSATEMCHLFYYLYTLESLYDGFYLLDSDLRFVVWNHGAEQLFGHESSTLLNNVRTSRLLGYADKYGSSLADCDCPMHQTVASGKGITREAKIQAEDGTWVDVELQSIPIQDKNGSLVGVAEVFSNLQQRGNSRQYKQLKLQASRDALTNVCNRGELENQLAVMMKRFQDDPNKSPFSVIFLDIDFFKKINDAHGHGVGDQVLINVAKLLKDDTYLGEIVARYGGEEFVILCPDTTIEQAEKRSERLRSSIQKMKFEGVSQLKVTSSFGVTATERGDSMSSVLRRADKALYHSKETGRNKTTCLTNQELLEANRKKQTSEEKIEHTSSQRFESEFHARVAADMIVYKLGGFVDDENAQLLSVREGKANLQLGRYIPLFPFWGRHANSQPVRMVVHFESLEPSAEKQSFNEIKVRVEMSPRGFVGNKKIFQERARELFRLLKLYFAAK